MQNITSLFVGLFFLLTSTTTTAQHTYQLDPIHTFVNFGVERFMVGEVTGHFNEFSGTIHYNPKDISQTNISATIQVESIDTGFETRDGHLKSSIWLDAENYPDMVFKSKKVDLVEEQLMITADLTIHGVTKELTFPVDVKGPFDDPTKNTTLGLSADLQINRQDFGITFSKKMDNGHLFIGNEVLISIRALAVLGTEKK